jgi:hypothetical protein
MNSKQAHHYVIRNPLWIEKVDHQCKCVMLKSRHPQIKWCSTIAWQPKVRKTCFSIVFSTKDGIICSTIWFHFGNTMQGLWCKTMCQWFLTIEILTHTVLTTNDIFHKLLLFRIFFIINNIIFKGINDGSILMVRSFLRLLSDPTFVTTWRFHVVFHLSQTFACSNVMCFFINVEKTYTLNGYFVLSF